MTPSRGPVDPRDTLADAWLVFSAALDAVDPAVVEAAAAERVEAAEAEVARLTAALDDMRSRYESLVFHTAGDDTADRPPRGVDWEFPTRLWPFGPLDADRLLADPGPLSRHATRPPIVSVSAPTTVAVPLGQLDPAFIVGMRGDYWHKRGAQLLAPLALPGGHGPTGLVVTARFEINDEIPGFMPLLAAIYPGASGRYRRVELAVWNGDEGDEARLALRVQTPVHSPSATAATPNGRPLWTMVAKTDAGWTVEVHSRTYLGTNRAWVLDPDNRITLGEPFTAGFSIDPAGTVRLIAGDTVPQDIAVVTGIDWTGTSAPARWSHAGLDLSVDGDERTTVEVSRITVASS